MRLRAAAMAAISANIPEHLKAEIAGGPQRG
jgi:hypothetical protein